MITSMFTSNDENHAIVMIGGVVIEFEVLSPGKIRQRELKPEALKQLADIFNLAYSVTPCREINT